jgi:hypothetical protein
VMFHNKCVNGEVCLECQRLTIELACLTTEAVTIQRDIVARTRARMDISQTSLFWLREAQVAFDAKEAELKTHRATHCIKGC